MKYSIVLLLFLTGCASHHYGNTYVGIDGETYYNHVPTWAHEVCEEREDRPEGYIGSLDHICGD